METLNEAIGKLSAAALQISPKDDQIIAGHVRDSVALLLRHRHELKSALKSRLSPLSCLKEQIGGPGPITEMIDNPSFGQTPPDQTATSNPVVGPAPVHGDVIEALTQAEEYFENLADVVDGSYGEPSPNREMSLAQLCRDALARITLSRAERSTR